MEFYLIKSADVVFPTAWAGTITRNSSPVNVAIEAVVPYPIADDDGDGITYSDLFENSLIEQSSRVKSISNQQNISRTLTVSLTLKSEASDSGSAVFQVRIFHDTNDLECPILERLIEVHEHEVGDVLINFKLKLLGLGDFSVEGKDLLINELSNDEDKAIHECELEVQCPPNTVEPFKRGTFFSGQLTMSVLLDHVVVSSLYSENFFVCYLFTANKNMLERQICTDYVIIAGNGAEVKCHKSVLAANSEVFQAMFRSGMKEATSNVLEMLDMTEGSVRAFLAFIYHWNLIEASKNCEVALQLFCAGHKYEIPKMEHAMQGILCAKPNDWFTADTTLKLLLFAQNVGSKYDCLQTKAIQVLKTMPKDDLLNSDEFKVLLQMHPNEAMEVRALCLEFSA